MEREAGEELTETCKAEIGRDLRAVVSYARDTYDPIYLRSDVPETDQYEDDTLEMFRFPLMEMHQAVWGMSDLHPALDEPDTAVYRYDDISIIQFPLMEERGIIVTVEEADELSDDLVAGCKAIVQEHS